MNRYIVDFSFGGFATTKSLVGLNSYKLGVNERVTKTNAVGLIAKTGRYGGAKGTQQRDIEQEQSKASQGWRFFSD